MSLFIPGMPCLLCQKPIRAEDEKVGFRPFVANEADPLLIFNDATVHSECLRNHPLGVQAQERYEATLAANTYANRICHVCSNQIATPDEYFGLGHLTDEVSDLLFDLNFKHFHRACLPLWDKIVEVHERAAMKLRDGQWQGAAMQRLVDTLADASAIAADKAAD